MEAETDSAGQPLREETMIYVACAIAAFVGAVTGMLLGDLLGDWLFHGPRGK